MVTFGETLKERRKELRLSLREFALRAELDAGNLSKIERGRLGAPQSEEVLDRICHALEIDPGSESGLELKDRAAAENARIPEEVLGDEEVMARMPILLRTVHNKKLSSDQLDQLIQMIREA